jgi:hypothetical protein
MICRCSSFEQCQLCVARRRGRGDIEAHGPPCFEELRDSVASPQYRNRNFPGVYDDRDAAETHLLETPIDCKVAGSGSVCAKHCGECNVKAGQNVTVGLQVQA